MKPCTPNTREVYVWLVRFFRHGEPYGIYIPAEYQSEAEAKFKKMYPKEVEIIETKMVFEAKGETM